MFRVVLFLFIILFIYVYPLLCFVRSKAFYCLFIPLLMKTFNFSIFNLYVQNLIDLAGSESSKVETLGIRRKEGSYINKSLLTLGTVSSSLLFFFFFLSWWKLNSFWFALSSFSLISKLIVDNRKLFNASLLWLHLLSPNFC